ncbi:MAG: ABC-F family ATP-binding cassette domain-containing protein [Planctomycetaceae bacterium]
MSHDRAFLGATCDRTLDLSRGRLSMFPGKVDAFLAHQAERRLHAERANAAVLARKRDLEDFIARNRARASTASRAKSKSKELERLEFADIAADEPTVAIRCPIVQPRQGPAVRCRSLAIGYPGATVASGIDVEIAHGSRAAIVGDNGQGKTTFLRTLVESLSPLSGHVKWGYGCEIGIYAQHVYTSLPEGDTVLGYLERAAAVGVKSQRILDVAGAMLFRGKAVEKRVSVLSGGERARLCLAGLLLGSSNVLVLDEPGNHLDVETVDALAQALVDYAGTVIFTSHDRGFVAAVATTVVDVSGGRVVNFPGDYAAYVARLNREIDAEEAADRGGTRPGPAGRADPAMARPAGRKAGGRERDLRREITTLERTIARLDAEKRTHHEALLVATDPAEAMRLHDEVTRLAADLSIAEERWLALGEELAGQGDG